MLTAEAVPGAVETLGAVDLVTDPVGLAGAAFVVFATGATFGGRRLVVVGGSSSTVYSRIKRPFGQFTSIRKFMNGSRIGKSEETRITELPFLESVGSNLSSER